MGKKRLIFIIISLLLTINIFAEKQDSVPLFYGLNGKFILSGFPDVVDVITAPLYWGSSNWSTLGYVCATGLIAYTFDEDISMLFNSNQNKTISQASDYFLEPLGSGLLSLPAVGVFYIFSKSKKDKNTFLQAGKAFVVARIIVQIPKYTLCRQSPFQMDPYDHNLWEGPGGGLAYSSFPSGHTASIFALATVLSESYKDKKWIGITSYSLATLSSISRIYDNRHWFSDVVIGACIGYGVGKLTYNKHIKISPVVYQQGGSGIKMVFGL